MSEPPAELKKLLLEEEQKNQLYSLVCLKELLAYVFQSLSGDIAELGTEEEDERIQNFDDIDAWLGVWKEYSSYSSVLLTDKRNETLQKWGYSLKVYYSSVSEYSENPEFIEHTDQCYAQAKSTVDKEPKALTFDEYKEFLVQQKVYMSDYRKDIDRIKGSVEPAQRQRYVQARITDYLKKVTGTTVSDIVAYCGVNPSVTEEPEIARLLEEIGTLFEEVTEDLQNAPLDKFRAVASSQAEKDGFLSLEVALRVLSHVFEAVKDLMLENNVKGREAKTKNFNPVLTWLEMHIKGEKENASITENARSQALTGLGIKSEVWIATTTRYSNEPLFKNKLERLVLNQKIKAVKEPKQMTQEQYLAFLDAQIEYLSQHRADVIVLQDKLESRLWEKIIKARVTDYCRVKLNLEIEDVMIFVQNNPNAPSEDIPRDKLNQIKILMAECIQDLRPAKKPVAPEDGKKSACCAIF